MCEGLCGDAANIVALEFRSPCIPMSLNCFCNSTRSWYNNSAFQQSFSCPRRWNFHHVSAAFVIRFSPSQLLSTNQLANRAKLRCHFQTPLLEAFVFVIWNYCFAYENPFQFSLNLYSSLHSDLYTTLTELLFAKAEIFGQTWFVRLATSWHRETLRC